MARKISANMARSAWEGMFAHVDFAENPFADGVGLAGLMYPTENGSLTEEQFACISESACALGDDALWITLTERKDLWSEGGHWHLDPTRFSDYSAFVRRQIRLGEATLYSPTARWGAALSWEDYAILGGTEQFVADIRSRYDFEGAHQRFAAYFGEQDPKRLAILPERH